MRRRIGAATSERRRRGREYCDEEGRSRRGRGIDRLDRTGGVGAAPGAQLGVVGPERVLGGALLLADEGHAVESGLVLAGLLERVPREPRPWAASLRGLRQGAAPGRGGKAHAVAVDAAIALGRVGDTVSVYPENRPASALACASTRRRSIRMKRRRNS